MHPIWLISLLNTYSINAQSVDDIHIAMQRVHEYFRREGKLLNANLQWLPNSAKVGTGFDIVAGSPICYTDSCQMEGFRRPVFKLKFTQLLDGSCTNLLIPEHVHLDCLPSIQPKGNTETISTLQELDQSMKSAIEFSPSTGASAHALRYVYSNDLRSIIDAILGRNSTIYFTKRTVSWARLTAFMPFMNLSDGFRYVIKHMPCCNYSNELDEYIRKYIVGYYGLTYIDDLLLGGIIQQTIVVSEENRKNLQKYGYLVDHETGAKVANALFSASIGMKPSEDVNRTQLNEFKRFSEQSSVVIFGGKIGLTSIDEWPESIPSNPVIVKFRVASLLDLLTREHFSNDTLIKEKKALIRKSLDRYIDTGIFCYKNCSGNGICVADQYFGIGKCKCNGTWSGPICSINEGLPKGILLSNIGHKICPHGTERHFNYLGGSASSPGKVGMSFCLTAEQNFTSAPVGTLCGFSYFGLSILCDTKDLRSYSCPFGYSIALTTLYLKQQRFNFRSCLKNLNLTYDAPGTLCGLQSNFHSEPIKKSWCGDGDLSEGKCPRGFTFRHTSLPYEFGGLSLGFCAKT